MKNILAENMRRYKTKNLFEQDLDPTIDYDSAAAKYSAAPSIEPVLAATYFKNNPAGTIQTINRKVTMVNTLKVSPNSALIPAGSIIGDLNLKSDKRLYGVKTWKYDYKDYSLQLKDDLGYSAFFKLNKK